MNKKDKLKKAEKKAKKLKNKLAKAEKALLMVEKQYIRDVKKLTSKIKNLSEPKVSDKKTDAAISEEITIVEENKILATESVLPEENV